MVLLPLEAIHLQPNVLLVIDYINNAPVVTMSYFALGIVTDITQLQIPNTVTDLSCMFIYNSTIVSAKDLIIPNTVTDVSYMFEYCYRLVETPVFPSSIEKMYATFNHCYLLNGNVEINANPTVYTGCFNETGCVGAYYYGEPDNEITITGSCSQETKQALASTGGSNIKY